MFQPVVYKTKPDSGKIESRSNKTQR